MTSATLNIRSSPRRMLTIKEAADYCGMTSKHFSSYCPVSQTHLPHGIKKYDIQKLDPWLDKINNGLNSNDNDDILSKLK